MNENIKVYTIFVNISNRNFVNRYLFSIREGYFPYNIKIIIIDFDQHFYREIVNRTYTMKSKLLITIFVIVRRLLQILLRSSLIQNIDKLFEIIFLNTLTINCQITRSLHPFLGCQTTRYFVLTYVKISNYRFLFSFL